MNMIYEEDFLGFSYGFRPGRSQHNALDALMVAIKSRRVNWILDADIAAFFDEIDHDWMLKFLEHRIADQRMLRLIRKWLKAGVIEDGRREGGEQGNTSRRGDLAIAGEHLPALHARSLDATMARQTCTGQSDDRALR